MSDAGPQNILVSSLLNCSATGNIEEIERILNFHTVDLNEVKTPEGFSPLHIAVQNGHIVVVTYLLTKNSNPNLHALKGQTPLQLAAMKGHLSIVQILITKGADINLPGFDGMTPIYAAALSNKPEIVSFLLTIGGDPLITANTTLSAIEIASKRGNTEVLRVFQELSSGQKKDESTPETQLTLADLQRKIAKSFSGLLGFETFTKNFSVDIFDFLQGDESRIRIFWGDNGTGKSEIGMRLGGLRDGLPGLTYNTTGAFYFSAADDGMNFGLVSEKIEPYSIVYLDDADKLFDVESGLKNLTDIVQAQQSLNTCIIKKSVYWILAGNFDSSRKPPGLSSQGLERLFGKSLVNKVDYLDWKMPGWTLENLLKAVKQLSARRGLTYEDDALLIISQYCLEHGAVMGFDRIDQALYRRHGGQKSLIKADEAKSLIASYS